MVIFFCFAGVEERRRIKRPGGCEATRQYFEDKRPCLQGIGTPIRCTARQNLLGHTKRLQSKSTMKKIKLHTEGRLRYY